ncbi:hypothetical protein F7R19_04910 [Cupriavidus pauculus]|nr:hypothetical protein F7R19_04910 [Cupriavidus pauculus]
MTENQSMRDAIRSIATRQIRSRWNFVGETKVEINMCVDGVGIEVSARSRSIRSCAQVFLHFFLNIIEQTNYDSP